MSSCELEGDELAKDIATRGFAFGQLLQFTRQYQLEKSAQTTADVVREIIIPHSKIAKSPFVDHMPEFERADLTIERGRKPPRFLMSHWWGNRFINLVQTIAMYISQKDSLDPADYTDEELTDTCWLCIFAVNQHISICGTAYNPCTCGSEKFKDGPRCEMNKFAKVMESIPDHCVALDTTLVTLRRVWVLSEIGEGLYSKKGTVFAGMPSLDVMDAFAAGSNLIPRIQDAEASFPADKDRILEDIKSTVTLEGFNESVHGQVSRELLAMKLFGEFHAKGCMYDINAILRLCAKHPELVNMQDKRRGNRTLLHHVVETACFDAHKNYECKSLPTFDGFHEFLKKTEMIVRGLLTLGADPCLPATKRKWVGYYKKFEKKTFSPLELYAFNDSAVTANGFFVDEREFQPGVMTGIIVDDVTESGTMMCTNRELIVPEFVKVLLGADANFRERLKDEEKALGKHATYKVLRAALETVGSVPVLPSTALSDLMLDATFTLEQLQDREFCVAHAVDQKRREAWLSAGDFQEHFRMCIEEFKKLPQWKKKQLKERLHIF
eukprot:TRINITY_DN3089_c0_g1_i1.p1 TRINITY_DN3089_c0_g1~~TRINITY_DN3089_c0_g1_i1.p1  ORF type:complete len:553 (+),score=93.57 TRINITY_DN3089_c0_g1_i1:132-1790(+)